jgi:hypothetical protein
LQERGEINRQHLISTQCIVGRRERGERAQEYKPAAFGLVATQCVSRKPKKDDRQRERREGESERGREKGGERENINLQHLGLL